MTSDWPSGLDQFGEFLQKQGLSFDRRGTVPHTGDKLWQYGTNKIGVRVVAALQTLRVGRSSGMRLVNYESY